MLLKQAYDPDCVVEINPADYGNEKDSTDDVTGLVSLKLKVTEKLVHRVPF
jgi:hypothetical protein